MLPKGLEVNVLREGSAKVAGLNSNCGSIDESFRTVSLDVDFKHWSRRRFGGVLVHDSEVRTLNFQGLRSNCLSLIIPDKMNNEMD